MDQEILWAVNHMPRTDDKNLPIMGLEEIVKARTLHESFSQHIETPFTKLDHMATCLGVKKIYLKDESYRFGLNALRVLGGSFSIARYIAKEAGKDVSEFPYSVLTSDQLREKFSQATFFTAADNDHGRGVAWTTNHPGQEAIMHMSRGFTQTRLGNIAKRDVRVDIQEMNYDGCVRLAAKEADEAPRSVMVQSTAWDGHEETPSWIIQGYGAMIMKAGEQLEEYDCEYLAHVFVQTGVDLLTGAVVGYSSNFYADDPPVFIVMEAEAATCLYKGITTGNEQIRIVDGDMEAIMTGLTRGEPNTISWDILRNHVRIFVTAPDWVAANGMYMLGALIKGDTPVTSGEPGVAPSDALAAIMPMDEYVDLGKGIGLGENFKALLFSTEDDTDPDHYKNIAWKGLDK